MMLIETACLCRKLGNAGSGEAGELWEGREAGTEGRRKGGEKVLGIFVLGRVNT